MLPPSRTTLAIVKPLTEKFCCTCGAAFQFVFPAWLALIVQVPAPTKVTVPPETVQTLVVGGGEGDGQARGRSRSRRIGRAPDRRRSPGALEVKLIVWLPLLTVNDCCDLGAAFQLVLPAWLALMVQVPTVTKVTVEPATVQTLVVAEREGDREAG